MNVTVLFGADALGRPKVDQLEVKIGIEQHVLHCIYTPAEERTSELGREQKNRHDNHESNREQATNEGTREEDGAPRA